MLVLIKHFAYRLPQCYGTIRAKGAVLRLCQVIPLRPDRIASAAANFTGGITKHMATRRWTFGDERIIPIETNEKKLCLHAATMHMGVSSQQA